MNKRERISKSAYVILKFFSLLMKCIIKYILTLLRLSQSMLSTVSEVLLSQLLDLTQPSLLPMLASHILAPSQV